MFNIFKKKYKYAELVNLQDRGFVLLTDDEEIEIDEERLIKALNVVGEKGWELVQSDDKVGFLFKKVK